MNQPTNAYEWTCYNAARIPETCGFGGWRDQDIAEYIAGKYDQDIAATLALLRSYA